MNRKLVAFTTVGALVGGAYAFDRYVWEPNRFPAIIAAPGLPYPLPEDIQTGLVGSSEQGLICAANTSHCTAANALGILATGVARPEVATNAISPYLLKATIAIEDQRFLTNDGCDVQAIGRAAGKDLQAKAVVQGGSTITRQLDYLITHHGHTGLDEGMECLRAMRMTIDEIASQNGNVAEAKRIIETNYVNLAYYGRGDDKRNIVGIQFAAEQFFGKSAKDLTLAESILLAGTVQSPSTFGIAYTADMITPQIEKAYTSYAAKLQATTQAWISPTYKQVKAAANAEVKDGTMEKANADKIVTYAHYLSDSAALRARYMDGVDSMSKVYPAIVTPAKAAWLKQPKNFPIPKTYVPINTTGVSFTIADKLNARGFTDFVLKDASNTLTKATGTAVSSSDVASGRYTIYTTLDTRDQTALNNAIQKDKRTASLDAAGVSLELGNVRAMVGSKNYKKVGINIAAGTLGGGSGRDPGSSNKPYLLATLYGQGKLKPNEKINIPASVTIKQKGQPPYTVSSGSGCSKFPCTMYPAQALASSSDTWAADMVNKYHISPTVANMNELGMNVPKPYVPALILGGTAMSPLQEAAGMNGLVQGKGTATFYDGKPYSAITKIVDSKTGAVIYQRPAAQTKQVFTPTVAKATIEAMKQVVNAPYGTAYGTMNLTSGSKSVAGKTGTGSLGKDSKDLWFTAGVCDKKPNLERTTSIWAGNAAGETAIPSYFFGSYIAKIVGDYFDNRPHTNATCDISR